MSAVSARGMVDRASGCSRAGAVGVLGYSIVGRLKNKRDDTYRSTPSQQGSSTHFLGYTSTGHGPDVGGNCSL